MMISSAVVDFLGVMVLILGFAVIAENFIHSLIRHLQLQSLLLAVLIGVVGLQMKLPELYALGILTAIFRGWIIPEILIKDIKEDEVWEHRELSTSAKHTLVVGIIGAFCGMVLYSGIYPILGTWRAEIPFILLIIGLLIIVLRKNAIAQISGYIVEENALLYMGVILAPVSFLLEIGILLDIIGAVMLAVILSAEKEYGPLEIDELSG